jgi:RHS repeat-associated protein
MDNEVSGSGNQYDYGFRIYNPRIGRFLSTDPLFKSYPELTPYQFASNTPIKAIDLDGLEAKEPEISFGDRMQFVIAYFIVKVGELGNQMQERDGLERGSNSDGFAYAIENIGNQLLIVHGQLEMNQAAISGPKGKPTASSTIRTQGEIFSTSKIPSQIYSSFWTINKNSGLTAVANEETAIGLRTKFNPLLLKESPPAQQTNFYYNNKPVGLSEPHGNGWRLELNIPEEYQKIGIGSEIFQREAAAYNYTPFTAMWQKSSRYPTGSSINLDKFNAGLKQGLTDEQAAWGTWSGGQASKAGYNKVEVTTLKNGDVNAVFSKTP